MFVPYAHGLITTPHIVVRATNGVDAVPEMVRRVDRGRRSRAGHLRRRERFRIALDQSMASQRFTTFLLTLFAGLGPLLIAIGLYGVLGLWRGAAHCTNSACDVALGARPGADRQGRGARARSTLVGTGLLIGVVAATAVGSSDDGGAGLRRPTRCGALMAPWR